MTTMTTMNSKNQAHHRKTHSQRPIFTKVRQHLAMMNHDANARHQVSLDTAPEHANRSH